MVCWLFIKSILEGNLINSNHLSATKLKIKLLF